MALLWIDGFDYYSAAQISRVWPLALGIASMQSGRFGGQAIRMTQSTHAVIRAFPNTQTLVMGFAFRPQVLQNNALIATLLDNTTLQCELRLLDTGALQVTNNGTARATSSAGLINLNIWYYIQFKATIADSGSVEVKIGNATVIGPSTVDTQTSSNAYANRLRLGGSTNTAGFDFDDHYFLDTSGSAPFNDFLGPRRVETAWPVANGDVQQFTQSPGTGSEFDKVDDPTTQDDDTTYITSDTAGHRSTFELGTLSGGGAISAISVNLCARKDDAGDRTMKAVVRAGGSNHDGTLTHTLNSSYTVHQEIWLVNPDTTDPFNNTEINNGDVEFGCKVEA